LSNYFVHPQGICESTAVGDGTRIWAFAHVLPGATIGTDCNLCDYVFVENDVVVGDRVTIKSGVQLWDGVRVGSDVFVGPNVTFTNDRFPRSKVYQDHVLMTHLADGASVGANATILPGVSIGADAMVGAGSVVTRDVPSKAIVMGNPARIVGYVDAVVADEPLALALDKGWRVRETAVAGATVHKLSVATDLRGSLSAAEFGSDIPFQVQRYFVVYGVPSKDVRGAHAHRECHQFLVCVNGSVSVVVDNGSVREEIRLDRPEIGVYVPPMIWGVQYKYSEDAVLLVVASHHYDSDDYIRDYDDYLSEIDAGTDPVTAP
jgi:acetyltransferase-like isoleucine patch superfamily enzyme/dTDP-4-dehydrorhamnose 3,5-epimerase-like enzyme